MTTITPRRVFFDASKIFRVPNLFVNILFYFSGKGSFDEIMLPADILGFSQVLNFLQSSMVSCCLKLYIKVKCI